MKDGNLIVHEPERAPEEDEFDAVPDWLWFLLIGNIIALVVFLLAAAVQAFQWWRSL